MRRGHYAVLAVIGGMASLQMNEQFQGGTAPWKRLHPCQTVLPTLAKTERPRHGHSINGFVKKKEQPYDQVYCKDLLRGFTERSFTCTS